jgi:SPP1 gp7 family putative phage head morphogenesis protein
MNFPTRFKAALGTLFNVKGWQQAWARGEDLGSLGGGSSSSRFHEAASQSAWVFRCLQLIAGPIRSVPLEWYEPGSDEQDELNDSELSTFWRRPAITSGGVRLSLGDFIELSCHWIGLKGQACWILDDTWLARGGVKSPLILARADRLTAIKRSDELLGWQFIDGAGRGYQLLPQQVIRPRFLNPYDDAEGLSPMAAAWNAASGDHAAGVFARNIASANGDQGVYVVSKSGTLTPEQRDQVIAQLRQKASLAKRGDFRAAFLTADVSIEDPKIKTVDDAFLNGRHFSRDEIAAAFGVPASMLQKMESYSIGAASDRYRLIDETCLPMAARLAEAMSEIERIRTARDLEAAFDWSAHSVMSQVRNEKMKAAADSWKCGIPWKVLNETMDLGLDEFPGYDQAWLPMSLEPVAGNDETRMRNEESSAKPEEITEPKALLRSNMKTLDGMVSMLEKLASEPSTINAPPSTKSAARLRLWKSHMAARAPSEKLFKSKITKALMKARAETLAKIESSEKALAGIRQRGVLDLIFSLADFTASLVADLRKAHQQTLADATGQFLLEIAREDDPWKMEATQVLNFLTSRENLIRDASREMHQDILKTLEEGLQKGETTQQLAARVRTEFNALSNERAVMIATTETGAAYGAVRHAATEELDIPFKQWLSAQDDRVRATHRRIDGTIVPTGEPFRVPLKDGGEDLMMHPCDSGGSAENVIQCRCVEIPMMEAADAE